MFLLLTVCVIGSLVFYFFIYHMTLIFKGVTQLEDTFRYDQRYEDYYDSLLLQSKWRKFTYVFGTNPFFWLLPISKIYFYYFIFFVKNIIF